MEFVIFIIITIVILVVVNKKTGDTSCETCRYRDVPADSPPCYQCFDGDNNPSWRKR